MAQAPSKGAQRPHTLLSLVTDVCDELEVRVESGGLLAKVKKAAEVAGIDFVSIKETAEVLGEQILGVAKPPAVTPGTKRKRDDDRLTRVPTRKDLPPNLDFEDADNDCQLTRVRTEAERAAESKRAAETAGAVVDVDGDENPVYIPAKMYEGRRPGYVFTTRGGRTGYYDDPVSREALASAAFRAQRRKRARVPPPPGLQVRGGTVLNLSTPQGAAAARAIFSPWRSRSPFSSNFKVKKPRAREAQGGAPG